VEEIFGPVFGWTPIVAKRSGYLELYGPLARDQQIGHALDNGICIRDWLGALQLDQGGSDCFGFPVGANSGRKLFVREPIGVDTNQRIGEVGYQCT
jgi:hypothetical protein